MIDHNGSQWIHHVFNTKRIVLVPFVLCTFSLFINRSFLISIPQSQWNELERYYASIDGTMDGGIPGISNNSAAGTDEINADANADVANTTTGGSTATTGGGDDHEKYPNAKDASSREKVSKPLAQNLQMEPVLFVHVGKAGGSTIRHVNNKAYKSCKEKKKLPSNTDTPYSCTLARMTPGKFVHIWNRQDTYSNYSRFLVTVRNPIDRLVSWFYFSRTHKRTHTIHSCYNTINDLVTATMLPKTNLTGNEDYPPYFHNTTNNCVEVGQKCLMGEQNCKHHNFYNNEVYMEDLVYWKSCYNKLNQQPQIADHNDNGQDHCVARNIRIDVIRQEYAEFDLFHVLKLWGVPPNVTPETGFNYEAKNTLAMATTSSRSRNTTLEVSPSKYISPEGVRALCEAICPELLAYKSVVANADNLNSSDVANAFQDLDDSCHVPVDEICGTEFHYRNYKQLKNISDKSSMSKREMDLFNQIPLPQLQTIEKSNTKTLSPRRAEKVV